MWQKEEEVKKTILPAQLSALCFLPGAKDEMFVSQAAPADIAHSR